MYGRRRADRLRREDEEESEEDRPAEVQAPLPAALEPVPVGESARQPPRLNGSSAVLDLQRSAGNQATCRALDALTVEEEDPSDEEYIDDARLRRRQLDEGAPGAGAATPTPAVPAAVPTNLKQTLTDWTPGASKYGFQLKFSCSSSSGAVADLQAQAPNLVWREEVTYSRNDFAHRIAPSNPTILPPGGVSFAPASTTVLNANELEFDGATDTHWMPKSAVRQEDFLPPATRRLPAVMESKQKYQFSTDGSTWTDFAGPFTLRREFVRLPGPPVAGQQMYCNFTTDKVGIHSVTETYKP